LIILLDLTKAYSPITAAKAYLLQPGNAASKRLLDKTNMAITTITKIVKSDNS
jgi:hypothetical protein